MAFWWSRFRQNPRVAAQVVMCDDTLCVMCDEVCDEVWCAMTHVWWGVMCDHTLCVIVMCDHTSCVMCDLAKSAADPRLAMGWLPFVGSLKSYVSFAEYRLFYRALLQKRPIILRSLLLEGGQERRVNENAQKCMYMCTGMLANVCKCVLVGICSQMYVSICICRNVEWTKMLTNVCKCVLVCWQMYVSVYS